MKVFVVFFCVVLCGLTGSSKAPFITPCKREDTACLKASAQKAIPILAAGVPELGIATMDPMRVGQVKTIQAGLDMDFRNTEVTGLKHCKVLNLKRTGNKMYVELKCSVNMEGDYTLGGKLLIMPIEGNGKYTIKIRDIVVKIMFVIGERMENGEKYWTLNHWEHTADVEKSVYFRFHHLFNGNRQLAAAIHKFANQNWRDIFHEVAPPIVKAIVTQILKEISKLFDSVPARELEVQ